MILSPVQIKTDKGETINGVLLEGEELNKVIELIDSNNADGLKGDDALVQMRLKEASRDLAASAR